MQYYYYLFGAACGFSYFVYQTTTIGTVYTRPDENSNPKFSARAIIPYLKLPFTQNPIYVSSYSELSSLSKEEIIARMDLLKLNWVFTTVVGSAIIGTTINMIV